MGQVKWFVGNNPTYKIKKLIDKSLPRALSNFAQEKAQTIYSHIIKKIKMRLILVFKTLIINSEKK